MTALIWTTLIALLAGLLVCRALARRHIRRLQHLPDEDSIDRAEALDLGGVPQWVTIRGQNRHNPVLLFLHGGPGTVFSGIAYSYQQPWEEYFTVVNWDQRGSGRSRVRGDDAVGLETLVNDALELIDYLRREFKQDKVFLLGHSWGGFLGLTLAHRRPERLHAFVGLAPLLGMRAVYREAHNVLTEAANARGDTRAVEALRKAGPQLPDTVDRSFLKKLGSVLGLLPSYGMSWHNQPGKGALFARVLTFAFFSPHLKLREILQPLGGSRAYVLGLFREIHAMHLPEVLGTRFGTPMILVSGEYDQQAPHALVRAFAEQIEAPHKAFRVLRGSAHAAVWEAPGQILAVLLQDALPRATMGQAQSSNS